MDECIRPTKADFLQFIFCVVFTSKLLKCVQNCNNQMEMIISCKMTQFYVDAYINLYVTEKLAMMICTVYL